jgi:hypothetical protein
VTSRRHRRLPSIWRDGSSLAEGETVIVMDERVVEAVNAGTRRRPSSRIPGTSDSGNSVATGGLLIGHATFICARPRMALI